MKLRKITKTLSSIATGLSVGVVVGEVIENNTNEIDPNAPTWSKIARTIAIQVGISVLSSIIVDASTKHISSSVDSIFDSINKKFKTKL